MLSCNECKELFGSSLEIEVETDEVSDQDIVDTETVVRDENLTPTKTVGLKNSISISNRGMKQTRGCCLMKNAKDCLVTA